MRTTAMPKEILYTTAIGENGELLHIDNATKGSRYHCPLCRGEFVLRKSGRTGKGSRRPHFAHNLLSPHCTPESVLHYSYRKLLIDALKGHQSETRPLLITWSCTTCHNSYSGNLLERVTSIKEEYNLEECRPDIALIDDTGGVVAVIEIVVTHNPEEQALHYYKSNHIVLIQIDVSSEEELRRIEAGVANPSVVDLCLNSRCLEYRNNRTRRDLIIETKRCNACFGQMNVCTVRTSHVFGTIDSTDFSDDEIRSAESNGVKFEIRFRNGNEQYHQIVCWNCKKLRSRYRTPRF